MTKNRKRMFVYSFGVLMFIILVAIILEIGVNDLIDFYKRIANYRFIAYILSGVFVVFIDKNTPQVTITWLVLLLVEPILGIIAYILFGRNLYKRRLARNMSELNSIMYEEVKSTAGYEELDFKQLELARLVSGSNYSKLTTNNEVKILNNGSEKFNELFEALVAAKDHIHVEYFIIKNDYIGNKLKDILIMKSKEGLDVRVLYDAVGCWRLSNSYVLDLKKAGVRVEKFSPVAFPVLSRELNYRNHRKIVVIDGKYGFVGGINVGNEYLGLNEKLGFWRDTHLKLKGDSVRRLQKIFLKDWAFTTGKLIADKRYYPDIEDYGSSKVQIAESGPDTSWESIKHVYFKMITLASDRLWITSPYFVPDEGIKQALISAAFSGIDVKLIIPSNPDHYLVYWATRDNLGDFLKAGVKIYTYKKGFIHSKLMICDNNIASVGTANMDIRSFDMNYEVNGIIYDEAVVSLLEKSYLNDLKYCKRIYLNEYNDRSIMSKILDSIGRVFSPLQ